MAQKKHYQVIDFWPKGFEELNVKENNYSLKMT